VFRIHTQAVKSRAGVIGGLCIHGDQQFVLWRSADLEQRRAIALRALHSPDVAFRIRAGAGDFAVIALDDGVERIFERVAQRLAPHDALDAFGNAAHLRAVHVARDGARTAGPAAIRARSVVATAAGSATARSAAAKARARRRARRGGTRSEHF